MTPSSTDAGNAYSTRNLVEDGGFSRPPTAPASAWSVPGDASTGGRWRTVAVPESDGTGTPRSACAAVLSADGTKTGPRLAQDISIEGVPSRSFAVRAAARCEGDATCAGLILSVRTRPGGALLCMHRLRATGEWARYRATFEASEDTEGITLQLELPAGARPGSSVAVTDVRLVGLLRSFEPMAVRFDTRGDMLRASSRLRAFFLEDYLHLLGCRTSLNQGRSWDVYVCQKVWPWSRLVRAKLAAKPVIFDLDDNELVASRLRAANVRGFARAADAVSVGSEFLGRMAAEWSSRVFLLDNPVDVLDHQLRRPDRPWRQRLVWFGMPENRWMLNRLDLDGQVTTITRGGSIEYELKTVDEHLVSSDLALLPVALDAATRAKNANRLVKCVGLGLPFLASDTDEHRRALGILGLPEDFLVASHRDWNRRIEEVKRDYTRYRHLVHEARPRAFDQYGVERLAARWLEWCAGFVPARPHRGSSVAPSA